MSLFVECLKRLYEFNMIDENKVNELHENKRINEKEKRYILGK